MHGGSRRTEPGSSIDHANDIRDQLIDAKIVYSQYLRTFHPWQSLAGLKFLVSRHSL